MIFYADASAFKKINESCQRFLAVTSAGADNFHEVPKRVVLAIDFAIRIFHGFYEMRQVKNASRSKIPVTYCL